MPVSAPARIRLACFVLELSWLPRQLKTAPSAPDSQEMMRMRRTLYGVMKGTTEAAAALRADGVPLTPDVDRKLARVEAAVAHALASSPDGETIAQAEELVALDALCDLHLAAQREPEPLRARLRPIVDEWIAHAARTGLAPAELPSRASVPLDTWLDAQET